MARSSFSAPPPTLASLGVTLPLPIASGGTGAATALPNTVFSGPASGGGAAPSFRAAVQADLPAEAVTAAAQLDTDEPVVGAGNNRSVKKIGTKAAALFYAGPTSGSPAVPTFRAIIDSDLPAVSGTLPSLDTSNVTLLLEGDDCTITTDPAVDVALDASGSTRNLTFSSGTKATQPGELEAGNPPSIATNNVAGKYLGPNTAGKKLGDLFPNGIGTLIAMVRITTVVAAFGAPDHIISGDAATQSPTLEVVAGPTLRWRVVQDSDGTEKQIDMAALVDKWHFVAITMDGSNLNFTLNGLSATPVACGLIRVVTNLIQAFYDTGDAGRFNGRLGFLLTKSTVMDATAISNVAKYLKLVKGFRACRFGRISN